MARPMNSKMSCSGEEVQSACCGYLLSSYVHAREQTLISNRRRFHKTLSCKQRREIVLGKPILRGNESRSRQGYLIMHM
jgi:hypothetical protein